MRSLGYARDYDEKSPEITRLFDLTDRVALITGGATGLGRAIGLGFARYGAQIALVDLNREGAEQVAVEIRELGGEARAYVVDVTRYEEVAALADRVVADFGQVDVLVNCAAAKGRKPILEMSPTEWQRIMDVNLGGTFNTCKAVGKHLVERGRGKVINFASIYGHTAVEGQIGYGTSKGGVVQLTRVLAIEWAPHNVQVNCLSPVHMKTESTLSLPGIAERIDTIAARIPVGRWGEPWEMIGPAVFLASDASGLVTGHSLLVDGGWMAGGGPG